MHKVPNVCYLSSYATVVLSQEKANTHFKIQICSEKFDSNTFSHVFAIVGYNTALLVARSELESLVEANDDYILMV